MNATKAEAVGDLSAIVAATRTKTPELSFYLSAVIRWLDRAPEIRVPNIDDLLDKNASARADTAEACWMRDPLKVCVPWNSCFIVLPALDNYGRAYLVRPFVKGLFHIAIFVRHPVKVALRHFTGTNDLITHWLPSVCEYWIVPGGKIRNKEQTIRDTMKQCMLLEEILGAYGSGSIMPIPADGCEDLTVISKTLQAFSESLRDLYFVLAAIGNRQCYLRETDYSDKRQPAFELRSVSELNKKGFKFRENPRADEELTEIIYDLKQCTICGNSHIAGGGVLTRQGETIGTVYAACRNCLDDPDHIKKLDNRLKASRQMPKPTIPAPETVQ